MALTHELDMEKKKQFITEEHRNFLPASVEALKNIATIFTLSTGAAYLITKHPLLFHSPVVSQVVGMLLYAVAFWGNCSFASLYRGDYCSISRENGQKLLDTCRYSFVHGLLDVGAIVCAYGGQVSVTHSCIRRKRRAQLWCLDSWPG